MKKIELKEEKETCYVSQMVAKASYKNGEDIKSQTFVITNDEVEIQWKTKQLIKDAINTPPQEGFTPEIMDKRFRVLNAVSDLYEEALELELEDADFETLKGCVSQMRGTVLSRFYRDFRAQFE